MKDFRNIGLLLTDNSGGFVVAQLCLDMTKFVEDEDDVPLEAEIYRLCSHRSATDHGEWEVIHTKTRDGKGTYGDINGYWETHKVFPYDSYLCWVDYNRGVIFCDVNRPSPELQYLALPLRNVPIGYPYCYKIGYPRACRAVCITKGGKMKFINVVRGDGRLSGWRMPDSGYTIKIFTLMHNSCDDMEWKDEVKITATEFWAMDGYDDQLPCIVPEFPLLSMDDPDIIYFVLKERRSPAAKTWVVTLDMVRMRVGSLKDITGVPQEDSLMASYTISCDKPFFPTEFSKYLQKAAS